MAEPRGEDWTFRETEGPRELLVYRDNLAGHRKLVIELQTLHSPSRPVAPKLTVPQCTSLFRGPLSAML